MLCYYNTIEFLAYGSFPHDPSHLQPGCFAFCVGLVGYGITFQRGI